MPDPPNSSNLPSIPVQQPSKDDSILGFDTTQIAGITFDELVADKTAIKMLFSYYRELVEGNNSLKNELNTYKSYLDAYKKKKIYAKVSAILSLTGTIFIGVGSSLFTSSNPDKWPGQALLICGIFAAIAGLLFSFVDG